MEKPAKTFGNVRQVLSQVADRVRRHSTFKLRKSKYDDPGYEELPCSRVADNQCAVMDDGGVVMVKERERAVHDDDVFANESGNREMDTSKRGSLLSAGDRGNDRRDGRMSEGDDVAVRTHRMSDSNVAMLAHGDYNDDDDDDGPVAPCAHALPIRSRDRHRDRAAEDVSTGGGVTRSDAAAAAKRSGSYSSDDAFASGDAVDIMDNAVSMATKPRPNSLYSNNNSETSRSSSTTTTSDIYNRKSTDKRHAENDMTEDEQQWPSADQDIQTMVAEIQMLHMQNMHYPVRAGDTVWGKGVWYLLSG